MTNKQSSFFKKNNSSNASGKHSSLFNAANSPMHSGGHQGSTMQSAGSRDDESLSPRPASMEDQIFEGFGCASEGEQEANFMEGPCFLKTKTDRFKEHWAVLNGNEIFCYRSAHDHKSRVMHCLAGTFVKEIADENCPETGRVLYPVKIVLPPNKSRILYFDSQDQQKRWM